jgi:hypothetical protein
MHRLKYLACGLALLATACAGDTALTAPTTTVPLTQDFTDATNGPLTPHGSQTFNFAAVAAGAISVQLITLNPDGPNGQAVGLDLGILDSSGGCQRVVHNDRVTLSSQVTATATQAGSLCTSIYDASGTLPGPETFDIRVTTPAN